MTPKEKMAAIQDLFLARIGLSMDAPERLTLQDLHFAQVIQKGLLPTVQHMSRAVGWARTTEALRAMADSLDLVEKECGQS